MKALRLLAFFLVGLALGGGSVAAFAAASDYGRSIRLNAPAASGARFTGAPIYGWADAPNGWGRMNDINKINIGSKSFDVTGGRLFSPQTLAKGAVSFARFGGPAWLGFMLAGLVWDEVTKRWLIRDVPDEVVGGMACREAAGITANGGYAPECDQPAAAGLAWFRAGTEGPWAASKGGSCYPVMTASWQYTAFGYNRGTCPSMAEERVATDQEVEDSIYAELVSRGMGSELARRLIAAGYKPTPDGHDATGPNSVPGETITSSTTGPNGTTTVTSSTTHNVTYNTNNTTNTTTVTVTTVTTHITTAPDGTTTTTTETTTPPEGQQGEEPEYTLDYQGSAMPEIPDFYEQQYPDGFAGEWDKFKGKIGASPLAGFLNGLSSGLPGGGSCPEWSVSLNFGAMGNFGTHAIAPPCAIWPFIKAVMILSALFVARRMVFGG